MLCFILICSWFYFLIFVYILGFVFKKSTSKGLIRKKGTSTENFGQGRRPLCLPPFPCSGWPAILFFKMMTLTKVPQVQFYNLKRYQPTKRTGICYYCLNEKLFITGHQGNNLLKLLNELISKCRHKNKFELMNHKTWPLCGKCSCSELFSGAHFSRIWTEYGDL